MKKLFSENNKKSNNQFIYKNPQTPDLIAFPGENNKELKKIKPSILSSIRKRVGKKVTMILAGLTFVACSKEDDPEPTPSVDKITIDDSKLNTITFKATPQKTFQTLVEDTLRIKKIEAIAAQGGEDNIVYGEVLEDDPDDILEKVAGKSADSLYYKVTGEGNAKITQPVSSKQVTETGLNLDGGKTNNDKRIYKEDNAKAISEITATEKIPEPITLENTITPDNETASELEPKNVGDIFPIEKPTATSESGIEVNVSISVTPSEILKITDIGTSWQVEVIGAGLATITYTYSVPDDFDRVDSNDDGVFDNYTATSIEESSTIETTELSFEQERAKVQEYLDSFDDVVWDSDNPIEIRIPLGKLNSSNLTIPYVQPMGIITNQIEYGPNLEYMDFPWGEYPFIGDDCKISLTFADGETIEFNLPDVKMDASTPEKREKTLNFLTDYAVHALLKTINQPPSAQRRYWARKKNLKMFIEGDIDPEVYQTFLDQQTQRNKIMQELGLPYRESIVENEAALGPIGYNSELDDLEEGNKLVSMTRSEFAAAYPELEDGLSINAQGASFLDAGITWIDSSQNIRRQKGLILKEVNQVWGPINDVEQNSVDSQGNSLFLFTDSRSSGTDVIDIQVPTEFIFRFMQHSNFTNKENALDLYNDQARLLDAGNDALDDLIAAGKIKG